MKLIDHAQKPISKAFFSLFENLVPKIRENFSHDLFSVEDKKNKYGEIVAKLDKKTNDLICSSIKELGLAKRIYSEELDEPMQIDGADFYITLDPLDGSSNIKSNNVFGTIVGVFNKPVESGSSEPVLSFFLLYGPVTTLIYSEGTGTHLGVFRSDNHFYIIKQNIKFPEKGGVFGIGGSEKKYLPSFLKFRDWLCREEGLKTRYCGAFVGDVAQILTYGGFFSYPTLIDKPQGKLRLFYEAKPISFIIENAGGYASDGKQSILNIKSSDPDARTPLYIGTQTYVKQAENSL